MKRLALLLPLLLSACASVGLVPTPGPDSPKPTGAQLESVAAGAYRAYVDAMSTADGSRLGAVFGGLALSRFQTRAAHLRLLRETQELQPASEGVVHWSARAGGGEAVLDIRGRERLVISGTPTAWDSYVEQWAVTVAWRAGWRVVEAQDLAPTDWWPA